MAKTKVLVVEDEILVAREIEGYLCKLGYDVVGIAASAAVALRKTAELQPDIILVDIVIKGEEDGIVVAEKVRNRYQIPVVYLTAYVDTPTLERAKRTCPFGYILKPFNQNDLRVALEIAMARYQAELDESNGSTNRLDHQPFEFLSILSHEIRNPLSAIQLSTTLLGDGRYPTDEVKKQQLLHQIQSSTECINQLIGDVLTIGTIEQANRQTALFNPEKTEIVELFQTLLEPYQWDPEKQHTITFSYSPNCIYGYVDQKLLCHLFNNMISNAIKYSPNGKFISLRLYGTDKTIYFEIQDQGIGILPEDLSHLFEPFQRGRNVGNLPGTGLGLAIAKRVVELHNGEITVNSCIDHGTTFTITLPQDPIPPV